MPVRSSAVGLKTENRGCALDGIAGCASAINFDALIKRSRFESPGSMHVHTRTRAYVHGTRSIEFPNLIALCAKQNAGMRNGYTAKYSGWLSTINTLAG